MLACSHGAGSEGTGRLTAPACIGVHCEILLPMCSSLLFHLQFLYGVGASRCMCAFKSSVQCTTCGCRAVQGPHWRSSGRPSLAQPLTSWPLRHLPEAARRLPLQTPGQLQPAASRALQPSTSLSPAVSSPQLGPCWRTMSGRLCATHRLLNSNRSSSRSRSRLQILASRLQWIRGERVLLRPKVCTRSDTATVRSRCQRDPAASALECNMRAAGKLVRLLLHHAKLLASALQESGAGRSYADVSDDPCVCHMQAELVCRRSQVLQLHKCALFASAAYLKPCPSCLKCIACPAEELQAKACYRMLHGHSTCKALTAATAVSRCWTSQVARSAAAAQPPADPPSSHTAAQPAASAGIDLLSILKNAGIDPGLQQPPAAQPAAPPPSVPASSFPMQAGSSPAWRPPPPRPPPSAVVSGSSALDIGGQLLGLLGQLQQ